MIDTSFMVMDPNQPPAKVASKLKTNFSLVTRALQALFTVPRCTIVHKANHTSRIRKNVYYLQQTQSHMEENYGPDAGSNFCKKLKKN